MIREANIADSKMTWTVSVPNINGNGQAGIEFLVMDHQQADFSKSECLDIEEELKY